MHNLEVWRTPPFIVCFHPLYQSTLFSGKIRTPTFLQFFKISNPHPLNCVDCPLWKSWLVIIKKTRTCIANYKEITLNIFFFFFFFTFLNHWYRYMLSYATKMSSRPPPVENICFKVTSNQVDLKQESVYTYFIFEFHIAEPSKLFAVVWYHPYFCYLTTLKKNKTQM